VAIVASAAGAIAAGAVLIAAGRPRQLRLAPLRAVDLAIAHGELVVIVGPSGSGKTTLPQIMSTRDRPTSREVYFDRRDASGASDDKLAALRAHRIRFVFRTATCSTGSARSTPPPTACSTPAAPRPSDAGALERVRRGHRLDHRANQMSGGEQKRTAIARAIAEHGVATRSRPRSPATPSRSCAGAS
jgi:putative ABC transport system ATP-binding protein